LSPRPLAVKEIEERVCQLIGATPTSSIRSYLRLNAPGLLAREERGRYTLQRPLAKGVQTESPASQRWREAFYFGKARLFHADCFDWMERQEDNSIHAVVTDPPYGLHEYTPE
jgi:hypothetical protein